MTDPNPVPATGENNPQSGSGKLCPKCGNKLLPTGSGTFYCPILSCPSGSDKLPSPGKLKPCPFCGGEAGYTTMPEKLPRIYIHPIATGEWITVGCEDCGAVTRSSMLREEAEYYWNRRAAALTENEVSKVAPKGRNSGTGK